MADAPGKPARRLALPRLPAPTSLRSDKLLLLGCQFSEHAKSRFYAFRVHGLQCVIMAGPSAKFTFAGPAADGGGRQWRVRPMIIMPAGVGRELGRKSYQARVEARRVLECGVRVQPCLGFRRTRRAGERTRLVRRHPPCAKQDRQRFLKSTLGGLIEHDHVEEPGNLNSRSRRGGLARACHNGFKSVSVV